MRIFRPGLGALVLFGIQSLSAHLPAEGRFPSLSYSAGTLGNPAALPAYGSNGWSLAWQRGPETDQLNMGLNGEEWGAAFRWNKGDNGYDRSEWSLVGASTDWDRRIFTGHRVSLVRSSDHSANSYYWSPGLILRPLRWFSLGFESEALAQHGPYQPRTQELGATIKATDGLALSWQASARNATMFQHLGSRLPQSLLLELDLLGMEVGFTFPLVDPTNDAPWRLDLAMPFGPYHNASVNFEQDRGVPRGFAIQGHSARASRIWTPQRIIRVPLAGQIAETEPGFSLFGNSAIGLGTIRNHFMHLQADRGANPIVFDFSGYSAGPAASLEIRRGIQSLKMRGTKTIAYVDDLRPSVMMAASAADRVVLQPSTRVAFRGISSEIMYYKGLMDWLGIKAEMLRHGRYKSAVEPYTADSMSQEARDNLGHLLTDWWGIFRDSIAVSRSLPADSLEKFAANPALTASSARHAGLADTLLYIDEIPAYAMRTFFQTDAAPWMNDWRPDDVALFDDDWSARPRIALLNIDGTIVDGGGGMDRLTGASAAGAAEIMELVDDLRKNGSYDALILRINSPGGSALASDELWHRLRQISADGIPIVASVGDMAASGGYYLACSADEIVAEPTSIVGSIGIFGGKVDLSGLMAKLKIRTETVSTHQNANAESPARGFTDSERIALQAYMDEFYGRFVNVVANARGLDSATVDSLGEGQVFTAATAIHKGLVDRLGGLSVAIETAKNLAGISTEASVEVVPLISGSGIGFRNLAAQAKIAPWRQSLESTTSWALWTPGFTIVP